MANLYEATLGYTYAQQMCINRFNYEMTGTPAAVTGAFGLASAMGFATGGDDPQVGTIAGRLSAMLALGVAFVDILVRNVYDPIDFYQTPLGWTGLRSGNTMPPNSAYGFYTNRTRLDIRRGTKRFPGVVQSASNAGVITELTTQQHMDAMKLLLGAVLTYTDEGQNLAYTPVIVQKEKIMPTEANGLKGPTYRYYESPTVQAEHLMRSLVWEKYGTIRSQNSRQFNRGQ